MFLMTETSTAELNALLFGIVCFILWVCCYVRTSVHSPHIWEPAPFSKVDSELACSSNDNLNTLSLECFSLTLSSGCTSTT